MAIRGVPLIRASEPARVEPTKIATEVLLMARPHIHRPVRWPHSLIFGLRVAAENQGVVGRFRTVYALQRVAGKLVLVEPKSKTSRRSIKLGAVAAQALRDHRSRQVDQQERLTWLPYGLVFTGAHGYPLDGIAVTKRFQAVLKTAGLPKMRFHDLRHSSASLLLGQGIPARVVMERLGHSNIALTLGTYSHVIPALHQEAADAIDRVLGG
jgi:integrase